MIRWQESPWVVLDTETTGLDPLTARVWEVALLHVGGRLDGHQMRSIIRPGQDIPADVVRLCRLDERDLHRIQVASDFGSSHVEWLTWPVEGRILVGYNILAYDWPLLQAECDRVGKAAPTPLAIIDPLILARQFLPQLRSRRLREVARHLSVPAGQAHRALDDCWMTAGVLLRLASYLPADLSELVEMQAQWREDQEADRQGWQPATRRAV